MHGQVVVPELSFNLAITNPMNSAALSERSLATGPYRLLIQIRNLATVAASLFLVALISTSLEKLSIKTRIYLLPLVSGLSNTIKSYEASKKGRETMKECLVGIWL